MCVCVCVHVCVLGGRVEGAQSSPPFAALLAAVLCCDWLNNNVCTSNTASRFLKGSRLVGQLCKGDNQATPVTEHTVTALLLHSSQPLPKT